MMNSTCSNLRTDHLRNPIGLDSSIPGFSWQLPPGPTSSVVDRVQVRVALDKASIRDGENLLWDTGISSGSAPHALRFQGPALPTLTPVYWSVRCWMAGTQEPTDWADPACFELGLGPDEAAWIGSQWIAREVPGSLPPTLHAPLLRRRFSLPEGKPVARARWSIATPGFCYAWLNGEPVMDRVCDPMRADSAHTIHYRTFDVTAQLAEPGVEQVLAVWLASGFYSPWCPSTEHPFPVLRAKLSILHSDGSETTVGTDAEWRTADSPVTLTQAYNKDKSHGGERWDMRLERTGWTRREYADANWEKAAVVNAPSGRLTAQPALAHCLHETVQPAGVRELEAERFLVDFGKTISGRVRLRFRTRGKLGKLPRLRLRHAEIWPPSMPRPDVLDEDSPEPESDGNNGKKRGSSELDYGQISEWHECPDTRRDEAVDWAPAFHLFCFRYVEIEAFAVDLEPESGIIAEAMTNEVADSAEIDTGDPLLDKIESACAHTWRCLSLYGGSLDCSHREKLGWGGEAEANAEFFLHRFDTAAFLGRYLADWRDAQREDGRLPNYAPAWGGGHWVGGPFYAQAPINLTWLGYLHSGDPRLLSDNFEMALRWVDSLSGSLRAGLIDPAAYLGGEPGKIHPIAFIGDWLPPRSWHGSYNSGDFLTDGKLDLAGENVQACLRDAQVYNTLHSVFTFKNIRRAAAVLGRADEAEAKLAKPLRAMCETLVREHTHPATGQVGDGRQAYAAFALVADPFSDVLPAAEAQERKGKTLKWLKQRIIETDKRHFDTGVLATTYLLKALMLHGEVDLALDLLQQRDFPGFGYFFKKGFDTIPEQWSGGGSSFCHASYSGAAFWFYQALGGLRPREDGPGWRKFTLAPQFTPRLPASGVRQQTPLGEIAVHWSWQDENRSRLRLQVTIPTGAEAELQLPQAYHCEAGFPVPLGSGSHQLEIGTRSIIF